jgi:hypothetical protein
MPAKSRGGVTIRLLLLLVLFVSVAGVAAEAEPRTVSVTADGYVEAIPDTLQLFLSVKLVGAELDIVQTQVDTITRDVVRIAGELGSVLYSHIHSASARDPADTLDRLHSRENPDS